MEKEYSRIWKCGDDVDTDQIIPSQYLLVPEVSEMTRFALAPLYPDFGAECRAGDVIVGGLNFGCGSSREQAPLVLKALGIKVVIAHSFGRIFFRNAINIGLPVVVQEELSRAVAHMDELALSFQRGVIEYKGKEYCYQSFPPHISRILERGGLLESIE